MLRDLLRRKEINEKARLVTATIIKDYPLTTDVKISAGEKNRSIAEKKIDHASAGWKVLVTDIQKNMNFSFFGKASFCKRIQSNLLEIGYSMDATVYIIEKLLAALTRRDRPFSEKPDYAEAYFNLGCMLMSQNHKQEALDSFSTALAFKPDYPAALKKLKECT
jgi:tetratricopeptide (TPR) repeat protein